ncbi:MAG: hypothetical protein FIA99_04590 [Ruminiclostridium sp.]|nr:hypothetical protein [Ruminiclostridium sp.]
MFPDSLYNILHKFKNKTCIQSICLLLAVQVFSIAVFSSCEENVTKPVSRREVSAYSERTIPVLSPYKLSIECDYGNLEFYNWGREEVKFEITNKVRADGMRNELGKMLEKFRIRASKESGEIDFICSYNGKGGKYEDTFSDIRIFMPGKPSSVECTLIQGKLNFFDDLDGYLKLNAGKAEVEINRLKGVIEYSGKSGSFRISSGEIKSNSSVVTETGNIRIKSGFESPGSYTFGTGAGVIQLDLPSNLNAVFNNNGKFYADKASSTGPNSKFFLRCGLGKIDINRF